MSKDIRLEQLTHWIQQEIPHATIEVASADASFRRYFRIHDEEKTYIAMDAPPEQEDCSQFINITQRLRNAKVHAPELIKQNLALGFLLLEDFGDIPYLDQLNDLSADNLYSEALEALIKIQKADIDGLAEYDEELLLLEMGFMPEWFLATHLGITPNEKQQKIIDRIFNVISATVSQQPQVFVHRDFHSRNLMVTPNNNPGVIDYQDAVLGPITYDLVSLFRDCYIQWPNERIAKWAFQYKRLAEKEGLIENVSNDQFIQWFDYMGLQRHIKVLGIFARLNHRDGKSNYLNDLPLTLHYVMEVANKYPLTRPLVDLFNEWKIPEKIGLST